MKCYIISYDLVGFRNYEAIHNAIKSYGSWAKVTESTWVIMTYQSSTQIRDYLIKFMHYNDKILVMKGGGEAAWNNAMADNNWLMENLAKI